MTGGDAVRAFIALEMPDEVREVVRREQGALRRELPRARWTRPEGQHLTLKFLGESPRERLAALADAVGPSVGGLPAVTVELGGTGFFPNPRRPRVAWIGGRADGAAELAAEIDRLAAALGWPREPRPWSLHLTQARLDRPWPRAAVERFLAWGRGLDLPSFVCTEAVLLSSELRPGGAVYTALERFPLA